ncbi:hypothetical protein HBB16_14445 [Pseudonocardia sp. MCCB 268]|nr:hypothetical protein [Pseudonocardia cytotoxica]
MRAAVAPLDTDTGGRARVPHSGEIADALPGRDRPGDQGEISTALTARVAHRATWCARCGADHVPDLDFRIAATLAGLDARPGPGTDRTGPPTPAESTVDARLALLDAWFRFDDLSPRRR